MISYTEQTYCSKYMGTQSPNDPPLPSLPVQYQTTIEANIYDKGKTVTGYEYFDGPGNRAMLGMLDTGVLHKLIFDYDNDELFYVTGDSCAMTSLTVDDNNLLFGNNFTSKGIPHVYTTGGALHFAASFGEHYLGVTTVRGITVDHWQSCLYWAPMLSNFTLDYYFTVRNWSDPIGRPQIPVRALARGVQEQPDGSLRNFTHYYDYVDFLPTIKDNTVFETPEGILCAGRNKTRKLPNFQSLDFIHYRVEVLDAIAEKVSYTELWYDGKRNYTRTDYRPPDGGNPVAEIHDFNYGTKYVIDQVSGACQILSLNGTDSDTEVIQYSDGTTRLTMATLKQLLFLDDSYAYTGQRLARGILCDVYSGEKTNFLKKSGRNATAIVDFFFLADGMQEYGDDQVDLRSNVPVQVIATIDALGFKVIYQFMDVGELEPRYSVFDISPCFPESSLLEFTVRMQGDPRRQLLDQLGWHTQESLAVKMGVSHIRIQQVNLAYDSSFVYVNAKLLPPFSPQPGIVNVPLTKERSSEEAYNYLVNAVYITGFSISVSSPTCCNQVTYTAVAVSVLYGKLRPKTVPVLSGQFSYGLENSVPNVGTVYNSHIWYDYQYQLVRYDVSNYGQPTSTIHDYNSGLAYTIDPTTSQCSVSRITNTSFDVVAPTKQQTSKTGYALKLRNPLQIFDLTNGYAYTGQKTVRGILCDVYENVANFSFGRISKQAVYQFYFMSTGWQELSKDSGVSVQTQPISLIVTAADSTETEHFDFYDFSEQHPDLSSFNIQPCFTGNQRRLFLIRFNQTLHPTLDEHKSDFLKIVHRKLSLLTGVSPLRFQNAEVTSNGNYTFYVASLVQQSPDILDFTKTSNMQGLYSMDATYVGVRSDDDCAGYCRNITAFACKSFDFCAYKGLCQLSKLHTADGNKLQSSEQCDHYSRTVDSKDKAEPSNNEALVMLQNIVDRTGFNVSLNISDTMTVTYTAIFIAPNLISFDNNVASSETLSHFKVKPMSSVDVNAMVQEGLFSIDDCAKKCLSTRSFTCDSFTYCQLAGECVLSNVHPDINMTEQTYSLACDLYIRRYTDKYVKYEGQTTQVQPDKTVHAVLTADVCAKNCYTNNEINCKSFDYCANTQTCYLKTSHILQISSSSVVTSSDCSHYSKMYLYDFVQTPNRVVSDEKSVSHILYYNVTAENCARLCVQNFGYKCKALSFCGNVTQCIIYSVENLLTAAQTKTSNLCHLYTRQYFDDSGPTATKAPDTGSSSQSASTGYTSGAMAGMSLAMLIIGMVLGVALLYFLRTKQLVQRKEEREMKNMEHENETDS